MKSIILNILAVLFIISGMVAGVIAGASQEKQFQTLISNYINQ